jgi:hypothetical protein
MQSHDDRTDETRGKKTDRSAMPPKIDRAADIAEARARADRIRRSLEGRLHSDSAALLREDRNR